MKTGFQILCVTLLVGCVVVSMAADNKAAADSTVQEEKLSVLHREQLEQEKALLQKIKEDSKDFFKDFSTLSHNKPKYSGVSKFEPTKKMSESIDHDAMRAMYVVFIDGYMSCVYEHGNDLCKEVMQDVFALSIQGLSKIANKEIDARISHVDSQFKILDREIEANINIVNSEINQQQQ